MPSSVGTAGSTEPVPAAIVADIEELNKSALLTTFFRLSHRAKYHQNQFYMYQWVFVFGAFLTTFFGGFTVLTSTQAAAQQADYTAQNALATSQITATLDTTVTQAAIANPVQTANSVSASSYSSTNALAKVSGFITTVLAFLIGYMSTIYNHFKPQQNWFACRRQTENLRAQYFLFLAHIGVYKNADRHIALRKVVIEAEKVLQ